MVSDWLENGGVFPFPPTGKVLGKATICTPTHPGKCFHSLRPGKCLASQLRWIFLSNEYVSIPSDRESAWQGIITAFCIAVLLGFPFPPTGKVLGKDTGIRYSCYYPRNDCFHSLRPGKCLASIKKSEDTLKVGFGFHSLRPGKCLASRSGRQIYSPRRKCFHSLRPGKCLASLGTLS